MFCAVLTIGTLHRCWHRQWVLCGVGVVRGTCYFPAALYGFLYQGTLKQDTHLPTLAFSVRRAVLRPFRRYMLQVAVLWALQVRVLVMIFRLIYTNAAEYNTGVRAQTMAAATRITYGRAQRSLRVCILMPGCIPRSIFFHTYLLLPFRCAVRRV